MGCGCKERREKMQAYLTKRRALAKRRYEMVKAMTQKVVDKARSST